MVDIKRHTFFGEPLDNKKNLDNFQLYLYPFPYIYFCIRRLLQKSFYCHTVQSEGFLSILTGEILDPRQYDRISSTYFLMRDSKDILMKEVRVGRSKQMGAVSFEA